MKLEVFDDADSVARAAAATIAADARAAIAARGRFALAVSGGHTPWIMLRALAGEDIPWAGVRSTSVWPPTDTWTAPRGRLYVDPELPLWLPEITLHGLAVGRARVDLRFWRDGDWSRWTAEIREGTISVQQEAWRPWSLD
jgi:hypothetical protein